MYTGRCFTTRWDQLPQTALAGKPTAIIDHRKKTPLKGNSAKQPAMARKDCLEKKYTTVLKTVTSHRAGSVQNSFSKISIDIFQYRMTFKYCATPLDPKYPTAVTSFEDEH